MRGATLLAAVVLAAAAAILLADALFSAEVLSQADALYLFSPWSDVAPAGFVAENPLLLDQSVVMQPWWRFCAERVRAGELPLWNPDNYLGQPMVAAYQSAAYWPLNWAYFAWPSPAFLEWSAFARLFAAGMFTFAFLRRIELRVGPALVGALAFMLCGFMVAWLGHLHTHVAPFLPALLWQVERTAARPRPRAAAGFALLVGLALLAGHVQTAVHVFLAVGAYGLWRTRLSIGGARLGVRGLGLLAGGALLGALLAAPQVLPFVEYMQRSSGAQVLEHELEPSREGVHEASVLMLDPDRYGGPHTNDYVGPEGDALNYNELIGGYVGLLVPLLAIVGLFWTRGRDVTWFFLLLALLAGLVAWQVDPFYEWARAVPKLRSTKLMRLFLVVAFALAVLAALGLQAVLERLRLSGLRAAALSAACLALVGGELLAWGRGYNPSVDPALVYPATPVTDFLRAQDGLGRALGIDNTMLLPSANLMYGIPMISGYDALEHREVTELVALMSADERAGMFIAEIRTFDQAPQIARLLGARWVLSRGELPPELGLALAHDGPTKVYESLGALPRAFAATSLRVLPDKGARLAAMAELAWDPYQGVLEALPDGAAEGPLAGGEVEVVAYEPRRVQLRATLPEPGLVVLTDAFAPGWRATANGEPAEVLRADHALRGVWLEAGTWTVDMEYQPRSTTLGLLGALGALLAMGGLVAVDRRRQAPQAAAGA